MRTDLQQFMLLRSLLRCKIDTPSACCEVFEYHPVFFSDCGVRNEMGNVGLLVLALAIVTVVVFLLNAYHAKQAEKRFMNGLRKTAPLLPNAAVPLPPSAEF